jgi:hypothetical protein
LHRDFNVAVTPTDANNIPALFGALRSLSPSHYDETMHPQLQQLTRLPILHNSTCDADLHSVVDKIKEFLREFAKKYG